MLKYSKFLAQNYKQLIYNNKEILITSAKGCWLYDNNKNKFLDASSGFSSTNLGHNNGKIINKLYNQTKKISILSRFTHNVPLLELGFMINNLFQTKINIHQNEYLQILPGCNGVDAVESAIKITRKYFNTKFPNKNKIICANGNFHGRTMTASSMSSHDYNYHFRPLLRGFLKVPYNNINSLECIFKNNSKTIAGIILEPIQGEGGIIIPDINYFKKVRELCDKFNVLLIADEIQTGLGRTGFMMSMEQYNVKPDILLLGKSLGGSILPISLCITSNEIMSAIQPGEHGSTFGGNPLASKIACASLNYISNHNILDNVKCLEQYYKQNLENLKNKHKIIKSIRGQGLMWGIELHPALNSSTFTNSLTNYGIITKDAHHNTVRITPPLIITKSESDFLFNGINQCLENIKLE